MRRPPDAVDPVFSYPTGGTPRSPAATWCATRVARPPWPGPLPLRGLLRRRHPPRSGSTRSNPDDAPTGETVTRTSARSARTPTGASTWPTSASGNVFRLVARRPGRTCRTSATSTAPIHVTAPPGDSTALFVVERDGTRSDRVGTARSCRTPFLDIADAGVDERRARACSRWPFRRTTPTAGCSTSSTPTTAATCGSTSSAARRIPNRVDPRASARSSWSSTRPGATTTAASSSSAPTATSTSPPATAAARATSSATPRTPPPCWARSCGSTRTPRADAVAAADGTPPARVSAPAAAGAAKRRCGGLRALRRAVHGHALGHGSGWATSRIPCGEPPGPPVQAGGSGFAPAWRLGRRALRCAPPRRATGPTPS